jgi:hypothetical protein
MRIDLMAGVCVAVTSFALNLARADDWMPPENPDPQAILSEAREDREAGRYAQSLAKHLWFHEHALTVDRAFYGVRLSFALSDWQRLGELHPPALKKLEQTRDRAAELIMMDQRATESFHDFAAINRVLGAEQQTSDLFAKLDSQASPLAKRLYGTAQPALIRTKNYTLCAKYVDPQQDLQRSIQYHQRMQQLVQQRPSQATVLEISRKKFANEAATLVAILAVNDRQPEAIEVARKAREVLEDVDFHTQLGQSLQGIVPEPWP